MVALDSLDLVAPSIPPITVHNESHMARDGTLLQGADKGLAESLEGPFCRGRTEEPVTNAGEIEIGHDAELPHTRAGRCSDAKWPSRFEYGRGWVRRERGDPRLDGISLQGTRSGLKVEV